MDQKKTGRFIAERRRELGLTQKELAEKLGITDRAVSKWENGRCMPDLSLLRPLSAILKVGINYLLSGEIISERDYRRKSEENLISMADLNLLKSFQFGFLGFYVMAVSMLIYCIVKNVETSGVLALICCYSTFLYSFRYRTMRDRISLIITFAGVLGTVASLIAFIVRTW